MSAMSFRAQLLFKKREWAYSCYENLDYCEEVTIYPKEEAVTSVSAK